MFESPNSILPKTTLDIELYLPLDGDSCTRQHMHLQATVRWTSELPGVFGHHGSNRYRSGAVFDRIDRHNQAWLMAYAKNRVSRFSPR